MAKCKENFLDDVAEISIHPVQGSKLPIPFAIQDIVSMQGCVLAESVMRIGYSDDILTAVQGSIAVKSVSSMLSSGNIYNMTITVKIEEEVSSDIPLNNISAKDHYVCLKTFDDRIFLCYTLPNTFTLKYSKTLQGGLGQQIDITLAAKSEFIPITLL